MLIFDLMMLVVGAGFLFSLTFKGRTKITNSLAILTVGLLITHLVAEGYRWQMVPAYSAVFSLTLYTLMPFSGTITGFKRWAILISGSLLFLLSVGSSVLFPMFTLPEPTGDYTVGYRELHLVDEKRLERYSEDPGDVRELMVKIWYPADVQHETTRSPYWANADAMSVEIAKSLDPMMPGFLFTHLAQLKTHSFIDVPVSDKQPAFPVLIFSHGLGMIAEQSTVLMEELASHGYVVASINHPYNSSFTFYPDGRVVRFKNPEFIDALTDVMERPEMAALAAQAEGITDSKRLTQLEGEMRALMPDISQLEMAEMRILSGDMSFVIDELNQLSTATAENVFSGRLDLSEVGLFGFSIGGVAAMYGCLDDLRCEASINLDGLLSNLLPPQTKSFMSMTTGDTDEAAASLYKDALGSSYYVNIHGATHMNFSDLSIFSGLIKMLGETGDIEGYQMLNIQNDYVRGFFDKHLKGQETLVLEDLSEKYPEVVFQSKM